MLVTATNPAVFLLTLLMESHLFLLVWYFIHKYDLTYVFVQKCSLQKHQYAYSLMTLVYLTTKFTNRQRHICVSDDLIVTMTGKNNITSCVSDDLEVTMTVKNNLTSFKM